MGKEITFTEEQISGLFGELAAEDERKQQFKDSFFKSDTYKKIHNDRPLRVLVAHKGIGKSAIFRMSYEENLDNKILSLWIRPNNIADLCNVEENESPLSLIEKWKSGLNKRIVELVMQNFNIPFGNEYVSAFLSKGMRLIDVITTVVKDIGDKVDMGAVYTSKKSLIFIAI